jgi:hypothetical protein
MTSRERQQAMELLRSLTAEDLAVLFYEAMQSRNDDRSHEDGDFWNEVYVIAIASHMRGEAADLSVLATAHESYPLDDEWKRMGPLNHGTCEACRTSVISTSKVVRCPVVRPR